MSARIQALVLGATGVVGQRLVARLARHPWFELTALCGSERSVGKTYAQACNWHLGGEPHAGLGQRIVQPCDPLLAAAPVAFSALDTEPAREIEPAYARAGIVVFSNASAFRMEPDVPLLIPEVNAPHLELLEVQRQRRGWSGGIVCNANCTATVLVCALAPLHQAFGVEAVLVTSLQALSGAGHPGVSALDISGNVIPYIKHEEEKLEQETRKLLGLFRGGVVREAGMPVSAACHRVDVRDGHTEAVSVRLTGAPSLERVRAALHAWRPLEGLALPSAPAVPLQLHTAPDRPQPRHDVEAGEGMLVHVGRLRSCSVLGTKFELLGHNAERGAAGAALLNAELARARGFLA